VVRLAIILAACAEAPLSPITFHEVTDDRVPQIAQTELAPDGFTSGLGAAAGDVDGDGRPDLFLAGGGLYLNRPDGAGFRLEAAAFPPVAEVVTGAAFGDYDGDGDLDLALAVRGGARLFANDGAGHFSAGPALGDAGDVSLSLAWGDLDGDGWLDLALANYGFPTDPMRDAQPSRIFMNRRDGSFAELPGLLSDPDEYVRASSVMMADFDGDGRLDVFFGDDNDVPFFVRPKPRYDRFLLNRGPDAAGLPILVDSTAALQLDQPRANMGIALGDAGHSPGWDLLFADIHADELFRSDGSGPYRDVTAASGIDLSGPKGEEWWQWGGAFADLDGDGWEDLLVGQAPVHPGYHGTDGNGPLLLRNRGGRFALTRYAFGGPMFARAVVLVDLDGDGDQDVVVAPFWDRFRFLVNDSPPRGFLRVELVPPVFGAVVTAGGQKRMLTSGGQPYSQSEYVLDFAVAGPTDVTVTWPGGARTTVAAAAPRSTLRIPRP
jgi:enediyne biosynthesis protein E4